MRGVVLLDALYGEKDKFVELGRGPRPQRLLRQRLFDLVARRQPRGRGRAPAGGPRRGERIAGASRRARSPSSTRARSTTTTSSPPPGAARRCARFFRGCDRSPKLLERAAKTADLAKRRRPGIGNARICNCCGRRSGDPDGRSAGSARSRRDVSRAAPGYDARRRVSGGRLRPTFSFMHDHWRSAR